MLPTHIVITGLPSCAGSADDERLERLRRARQHPEPLRHFRHELVAEVALQSRDERRRAGLVDADATDAKALRQDVPMMKSTIASWSMSAPGVVVRNP
jgi:hypothetical protein